MASPKDADIGDEGLVEKPDTTLIKPITNPADFHKAIHDSEVVVVYAYAAWCGYCRRMTPLVERAARSKEFEGVMFYKVDNDCEELENTDVIDEELYVTGLPAVFVFYLGKVFRFIDGYEPDISDLIASAVSASEIAMDGAIISHPDLLKGDPPTIKEITSLEEYFQIINGQQLVVLYLHSTRSSDSEHKYLSRIFECWAVLGRNGLYCILDADKHTEIVEELEIEMVTGVVGFYGGKVLGWLVASRQTWGEFGEWISDLFNAIEIVDSASVDEETASDQETASNQIMPITEITSWAQLREIVSAHNYVAINLFVDHWPSSRAVSLVFERAAADSMLNDIYFAKVNVGKQEDIAHQLEAQEGTIILFSDGEPTVDQPEKLTFDPLKKDLLKHIGALDDDELETEEDQADELASEEEDTSDDDELDTEEDQADELETEEVRADELETEEVQANELETEGVQADELASEEEDTSDDFVDALETDAKPPDELTPGEVEELQADALGEIQTPVLPEAIKSEELNISGTVSKAGPLKGTEPTISLTNSVIASRFTCQGRYQLRPQRPIYKRALNIQPKSFSDYENGCLFTPKSKEQRLQIGLANEADSRFSIELSCDKHVGGETIICFHINFIVDPTANARYQSAVFEVNFSQLENDDGHECPLTVRDFEPKDQQGEATEVQVGRAVGTSVGASAGYSLLSLSTASSLSTTEQYTKKTASRIMGACVSPSTVNWAFKEDEGPAGRNGLATTHVVHARIPSTGLTSIRFWAKAILMRPRRPRVGLRIGSIDSLSEKLLDLHVLHLEKA